MSIEMRKEKRIRAEKLQFGRTDLSKEMPITEVDKSSNKLNIGAMLEAIYNQIYGEDSSPEGGSGRSVALSVYDRLNEISVEQFQMSARAFVDQMLMDREFIDKKWESSESRPFSDALEILKSNEDLLEKIKYRCGHSSKGSFTSRISEKVVVPKPSSNNTKYSENVSCHCSLLQSHHRSSSKVPNVKSTSFSFSEMKRKLKYSFGLTRKEPYQTLMDVTTVERSHSKMTSGDESPCQRVNTGNSVDSSTGAKLKDKNQGLKSSCFSENFCMNEPVINKSNSSSNQGARQFDVILEAKMHLSTRLETLNAIETLTSNRCPKILGQIISSPEHDIWLSSLSRKKENGSVSDQMRFSPYGNSPASCQTRKGKQKYVIPLTQNEEPTPSVDFRKYDSTLEILESNRNFSLIGSADTEVPEKIDFATVDLESNGRAKMVELESIPNPEITSTSEGPSELSSTDLPRQKTNRIDLLEEDGNTMHLRLDSPSVLDDCPWTLSTYQLDDSTKDREEHPSPVSVLEPFFTEDVNSPPNIILRRAGRPLQLRRRLDYEGCSSEASPIDPTIIPTTCIDEKDSISGYVNAVLQASRLNWDELSAIMPLTEQLIYESLFDEVEFPSADSPYDPKLLFDHINEVLLEVHRCHFGLAPWLSFIKSKIQLAPLEQQVIDQVMKEADFYLLPRTGKRTLDQLVGKDVANSGSWVDIMLYTEEIEQIRCWFSVGFRHRNCQQQKALWPDANECWGRRKDDFFRGVDKLNHGLALQGGKNRQKAGGNQEFMVRLPDFQQVRARATGWEMRGTWDLRYLGAIVIWLGFGICLPDFGLV
ncbi:unnamed protein product [Fraxinus pennsylvanica]|uniref:DUF4378 domain-containing protein n=1 Tax=Fraxinus pennsylvanica TaxID=56036 RepID=A0AAD1YRY2_9LAMI|nr:unnamed protein product [Fraxinus pennsylvanica]